MRCFHHGVNFQFLQINTLFGGLTILKSASVQTKRFAKNRDAVALLKRVNNL